MRNTVYIHNSRAYRLTGQGAMSFNYGHIYSELKQPF